MAQYYEAVGRRKESTARVRLAGGSGAFTVNDKEAAVYFPRIGDLNEQQLSDNNERNAALLSSFQTRLAGTVFITLLLSIAMAAFSMRKILKLEEHAHLQYHEVYEARRQLENLSARLVQAQEAERRERLQFFQFLSQCVENSHNQ